MHILAERLAELRKKWGYTQKQVCEGVGISSIQVLSNYEKDNRTPDADTIAEFARFYKVSADYLLGTSPFENPANAEIGERLGLSDVAIHELERFNSFARCQTAKGEALINTVNHLLENGEKYQVFSSLYYFFNPSEIRVTNPLRGFDVPLGVDGDVAIDMTVTDWFDVVAFEKIKDGLKKIRSNDKVKGDTANAEHTTE